MNPCTAECPLRYFFTFGDNLDTSLWYDPLVGRDALIFRRGSAVSLPPHRWKEKTACGGSNDEEALYVLSNTTCGR